MKDTEKVKEFIEKNGLEGGPEEWVLDVQSELGEVAKEVLRATDYGVEEPEFGVDIEDEVGDLYFSLLGLASVLDIDVGEALERVLKKYGERVEERGSAGSGE